MIAVLLADDHAIVRSGLRQIFALVGDIHPVGEATQGDEVLALVDKVPADVLLLDLNMPGISGADLITRVKAHRPQLPILVLSMHNEAQVAARMLKAGASGYITKDCEPDILIAAIRKVAAQGRYIAPEIAEQLAFERSGHSDQAPHARLSEREWQIFQLLTQGRAVSEIAAELHISSKTVSTHKTRLFEKLNLSSVAELVRYAIAHRV